MIRLYLCQAILIAISSIQSRIIKPYTKTTKSMRRQDNSYIVCGIDSVEDDYYGCIDSETLYEYYEDYEIVHLDTSPRQYRSVNIITTNEKRLTNTTHINRIESTIYSQIPETSSMTQHTENISVTMSIISNMTNTTTTTTEYPELDVTITFKTNTKTETTRKRRTFSIDVLAADISGIRSESPCGLVVVSSSHALPSTIKDETDEESKENDQAKDKNKDDRKKKKVDDRGIMTPDLWYGNVRPDSQFVPEDVVLWNSDESSDEFSTKSSIKPSKRSTTQSTRRKGSTTSTVPPTIESTTNGTTISTTPVVADSEETTESLEK